ncbi:MAG: D-glycero-beta-D-manno-heptose-7-phosphate kinase [Desulfobacteraceae bacterium]|jgi:D-beta-D-heptose 7-phosphate kinase/D-beta-D-heptose 1-phosphate adenosyltransferase|nr:D-glycero-beta-D-manno-heptose-7-phosphate kinase [Desulfobacteraceae bacterium]
MIFDISKFDQTHLLVIGDLMIDEYVWGKVDRISPEAPVQVVAVKTEDYTLGGSGNVVNNLVALGARVTVLGVVGEGSNGKLLCDQLDAIGADTRGIIQEPGRHTTKKTRIIAEHQQVLRIDRETKKEISPATAKNIIRIAEKAIPNVDVILISDYGKGLINRSMIKRLVQIAKTHNKPVIADPKGLDFTKYAGVNLLTPNKKEASLASGREITDARTLAEVGKILLDKCGMEKLLITCGKDGMVLFEKDLKPFKIGTKAQEIYDVSGAGDTVVAVLGLAIAAGQSFKKAVSLANTAAGIVVGKVGTATVTQKELSEALKASAADIVSKHKTLKELCELCRKLQKDGKRIVLTNGCFDLLHVGHIKLFSASKKLGDVMIVAIDDDDSVRRLKGPDRPVIGAPERVRILSALDSVDHVVVFAHKELDNVIESIRPDILTKGSNYGSGEVLGREIVEGYGGRVESIPITEKISSTQIINTIKKK